MRVRRGNVVEVFSSIQGEGHFVGRRHIFVRLAGCGFGCRYCDQPESRKAPRCARIEQRPWEGDFRERRNPVKARDLAGDAIALDTPPGLHHAFSITGGEPLEQAGFLESLLPDLAASRPKIMLETNGTLPDELRRVIQWVDFVSMDYKLTSATGVPAPEAEHRRFLEVARSRHVAVKMVVAAETSESEVESAVRVVAAEDAAIPLVLQPVTAAPGGPGAPSAAHLFRLHAAAARWMEDVRVIGQMHRLLGFR